MIVCVRAGHDLVIIHLSWSPKTRSRMGFLCTSAVVGLFGQRWPCLASCPYLAAPEQKGDRGSLEAELKSVKQLCGLKSYSFLLALDIFSFKAV